MGRTGLRMWVVLASVTLMSPVLAMMPKLESSCETVANRIHITKEEFSKAKELMRTCVSATIKMDKCLMETLVKCRFLSKNQQDVSVISVEQHLHIFRNYLNCQVDRLKVQLHGLE